MQHIQNYASKLNLHWFFFSGSFYWEVDKDQHDKEPELLFTENDTNYKRLFNIEGSQYAKDAFHNYVIKGIDRINQKCTCCKF